MVRLLIDVEPVDLLSADLRAGQGQQLCPVDPGQIFDVLVRRTTYDLDPGPLLKPLQEWDRFWRRAHHGPRWCAVGVDQPQTEQRVCHRQF